VAFDPQRHYPLGTERPDLVTTPGGLSLDQLTLHGAGVESSELRVRPETLRLQADVAAASGRSELAANLRRAAELAPLSDAMILEVYTALRPRRSTAPELEDWAGRLDESGAPLTAAFVRDALVVYRERGLLAG
jgi:propanediol dehydratase small subunit